MQNVKYGSNHHLHIVLISLFLVKRRPIVLNTFLQFNDDKHINRVNILNVRHFYQSNFWLTHSFSWSHHLTSINVSFLWWGKKEYKWFSFTETFISLLSLQINTFLNQMSVSWLLITHWFLLFLEVQNSTKSRPKEVVWLAGKRDPDNRRAVCLLILVRFHLLEGFLSVAGRKGRGGYAGVAARTARAWRQREDCLQVFLACGWSNV